MRYAASMRGGWWAGLIALGMLCQVRLAHAECGKDLDCEGEQICEAGQCVAPPAPAPAPARARDSDEPAPPRPAAPPRRRLKHPGLLALGITSAGVGTVVLLFVAASCSDGMCHSGSGEPVLLGTLGLVGLGVPLIVLGAEREPVPTVAVIPIVSPRQGGLSLQLRL